MSTTWFYYDSDGEKQGPVSGGRLKGLAKAGLITPETVVETEDGKKARAGKVKGLTFATPTPPVETETYGLSQTMPPPEPSPFTATMPVAAKPADNPFTAPLPVAAKPSVENTSIPATHYERLMPFLGFQVSSAPPSENFKPNIPKPVSVLFFVFLLVVISVGVNMLSSNGGRPSGGGGGRVQPGAVGQNQAPAVPAPQPLGNSNRAMQDTMSQIEKITRDARIYATGSATKEHTELLRRLYRDLEYNIDGSKYPQDFQTAFEKYKRVFNNYMERVIDVYNCSRDLDDAFSIAPFSGNRVIDVARNKLDVAGTAFARTGNDLDAALSDLKFVVDRHTK